MPKELNNKLIFWVLIAIFLLLQIPFLDSVRHIIVDESSYSNVAYNFSTGNGFVNTNVGSMGGDICFLYPLIEGLFFFVFGTTLYIARFVSVVAGIFSVYGFLLILKYLKIKNSFKYLSVILLLFSYNYYVLFRFARPEAWVFCFFIWMIYFQLKYWEERKKIYIFITGVFAGLSFLTHPWGLSFIFLFGVYYIIISVKQKNLLPVILYSFGIAPTVLAVLLNALVISGIPVKSFLSQFENRSAIINSGQEYLLKAKLSFMEMFKKYNLTGGRFYILLFHSFITFYGLSFFKKNITIFRFSLIQISLVFISLVFFNGSGIELMLQFIFAFTFLNVALLLNDINVKPVLTKTIFVLAFLFFCNNVFGIYSIIKKESGNPFSEVSENINKYVPKSTVVLSPLEFWLPFKENEFYNSNFSWEFKKYKTLTELLESKNLDYIIQADDVDFIQTEENIKAMEKYITDNGTLIASFATKNYGTISIWKVKKSE